MNCRKTRKMLNAYLDDSLLWMEAEAVESHLGQCHACVSEYRQLLALKQVLRSLNRREPPSELALQLRIEISKLQSGLTLARACARMKDFLRPVLLPAFSGVVLTFFLFLVPFNSFFPGSRLSASGRDIPIGLFTDPRPDPAFVRQFMEINNINNVEKPFTVETYIGMDGRVISYTIIDGPRDQETIRKLDQFLLFQGLFEPATYFGKPTTGKFLWSFDKIDVVG
jgi:hypothetical protein